MSRGFSNKECREDCRCNDCRRNCRSDSRCEFCESQIPSCCGEDRFGFFNRYGYGNGNFSPILIIIIIIVIFFCLCRREEEEEEDDD